MVIFHCYVSSPEGKRPHYDTNLSPNSGDWFPDVPRCSGREKNEGIFDGVGYRDISRHETLFRGLIGSI